MPSCRPVGIALPGGTGDLVVIARISPREEDRRLSGDFCAVFYTGGPVEVASSMHSWLCDAFVFSDAEADAPDVVLLGGAW